MPTDLWTNLKNENRPIVLYGMGNGAEAVLKQLSRYDIRPAGFFASDAFVRGQTFCGYAVERYATLAERYPDMIILVCFGSAREEVLAFICELAERHTVFCPDVPVYGEQIFDLEFVRKHKTELQRVYTLLDDDLSRKTFEAIVRFKLSGEMRYLQQIECKDDLFAPFELSNDEIYMDLGAYRGDTVDAFLEKVSGYRHIFAIEPNAKTFLKLSKNLQLVENCTLVHAAISDRKGNAMLSSDGRGTTIVRTKGVSTPTTTIDALAGDKPISLIKMDVEGQERAALLGGQQTIAAFRPKMVIAGYHRSEDLFTLPLQVLKSRDDYKVLLRHFRHNLAWDTNFYFI